MKILSRQGKWISSPREVTVSVIRKGEQEFIDTSISRNLVF
ncbi:hypothetical protein [Richelia intracellularis]|nr:hypothetical protein [Richelia intracellularis]